MLWGVSASCFAVHLAYLEDVLQTVESDLDDLVVHAAEKVAKRLDAALRDKVADLLGLGKTTAGCIADSPAGFLLGLEVGVLKDVDEGRDDVGVNDGLNLLRGTGGDVGDSQQASLRMPSLGEERSESKGGKEPDEMTTWVW